MIDSFEQDLTKVFDNLKAVLIAKNHAYSDSALNPLRIFSKSDAREQINVRIDDKLSCLARGSNAGEDVKWDLLGYLVLDQVAQMRCDREKQAKPEPRRWDSIKMEIELDSMREIPNLRKVLGPRQKPPKRRANDKSDD